MNIDVEYLAEHLFAAALAAGGKDAAADLTENVRLATSCDYSDTAPGGYYAATADGQAFEALYQRLVTLCIDAGVDCSAD